LGAFAQQFSLSGNIKGIKNGTMVKVVCSEGGNHYDIAKCLSKGSSFKLVGHVNGPTLVELSIDDKPMISYKKDEFHEPRGVVMMMDNVVNTISAACYDSIPKNWEMYDTPLHKIKNVVIKGGIIQQQYNEFKNYIYKEELEAWESDLAFRKTLFPDSKSEINNPAIVAQLKGKSLLDAKALTSRQDSFMYHHPNYAISLFMLQQRLENLFTYTNSDYDAMLKTFNNNIDKVRYNSVAKRISFLRRYVKGTKYTDFVVADKDSTEKHLSDYIKAGQYNFIDFWASWCGPCRAAIPNVKDMHTLLGEKLNVVSVSVDRNKQDWYQALDEEKMTWAQTRADSKETLKTLSDAYGLTAIPFLLIIDNNGKIVLSTNDPDIAESYLKSILK
jgi:thiol-disulfide isomerase/thioredoxin